jgi:hypothetical protein
VEAWQGELPGQLGVPDKGDLFDLWVSTMRKKTEKKKGFVHGVFLRKYLGQSVGVITKNQLQVCALTASRGLIKIKEAVSAIGFRGVFLLVFIPPPPIFSERKESH